MKTKPLLFLLIIPFLLAFTSNRKQKREILRDVNHYKKWVVKNARFDLSQQEFVYFANQYFEERGFKINSAQHGEIVYQKQQIYLDRTSHYEPAYRTETRQVESVKDGAATWHTVQVRVPYQRCVNKNVRCTELVQVVLNYEPLNNGFKVSTYKRDGKRAICKFSENDFKHKLYAFTYGNKIPLPETLVMRIKEYNASVPEKQQIGFN